MQTNSNNSPSPLDKLSYLFDSDDSFETPTVIGYRGLHCNIEHQSVESLIAENETRFLTKFTDLSSETIIPQHDLTVDEVVEIAKATKKSDKRLLDGIYPCFVTTDMTYAKNYATGGCCDKYGKIYHHDGIVLHYKLNKDLLRVDGQDFLYSIYLYALSDKELEVLKKCYGEKIVEYYNALDQLKDCESYQIFTFIDYITLDKAIIEAHLNSNAIIAGRRNRVFQNSFAYYGEISSFNTLNITEIVGESECISRNRWEADINTQDLNRR